MSVKHNQAKQNIRQWFSRHGGFVMFGSVAFILFGLTCIIVGFYLAGTDILAWFTSRWAFLVYAAIIIWIFAAGFLWYWGKMNDHGE